MEDKYYEIIVDCPYQSDVVTCMQYDSAIECAEQWAKEIDYRYPVVVQEVIKKEIYATKKENEK